MLACFVFLPTTAPFDRLSYALTDVQRRIVVRNVQIALDHIKEPGASLCPRCAARSPTFYGSILALCG
jgi:hypothetical protein